MSHKKPKRQGVLGASQQRRLQAQRAEADAVAYYMGEALEAAGDAEEALETAILAAHGFDAALHDELCDLSNSLEGASSLVHMAQRDEYEKLKDAAHPWVWRLYRRGLRATETLDHYGIGPTWFAPAPWEGGAEATVPVSVAAMVDALIRRAYRRLWDAFGRIEDANMASKCCNMEEECEDMKDCIERAAMSMSALFVPPELSLMEEGGKDEFTGSTVAYFKYKTTEPKAG